MKIIVAQPILCDELVMNKIYLLRGKKVMLDSDLAELYGVQTKALKQAVKRNDSRFLFVLTKEETPVLRSQNVYAKRGSGGTRYLPFAFTEQGVAMLSSILNSDRAIDVNIQIIRVFTKMCELLLTHKEANFYFESLGKKAN